MRTELEQIALIEDYLLGTLGMTERNALENEMQLNAQLRSDVQHQHDMMKGLERYNMIAEIKQARYRYKLYKWMTYGAITAAVALAAIATWSILQRNHENSYVPHEATEEQTPALTAPTDSSSVDQLHQLQPDTVGFVPQVEPDTNQTPARNTYHILPVVPVDATAHNTDTLALQPIAMNKKIPYAEEAIEDGNEYTADADRYLKPQTFELTSYESQVLETEDGILIACRKKCFVDKEGNVPAGKIDVVVREAFEPLDILRSGLSTVSGKETLQTAGMIQLHAFTNGEKLSMSPQNPVVVSMPCNGLESGLKLWEGEIKKDGSIDWQNPQAIEQILTPIDITTLDFYPPDLLSELSNYGFNIEQKQLTDSLYLSFENYSALDESGLSEEVKQLADTFYSEDPFDKSRRRFYASKGYGLTASSTTDVVNTTRNQGIPPSTVLAMWNVDYNNTNIATHEFEQRMKVIHTTCSVEILQLYLNNLNKPLWQVDQLAAHIAPTGELVEQFEKFAARFDGAVSTNDVLTDELYQKLKQRQAQYHSNAMKVYNELQQKTKELYADRNRLNSEEDKRAQRELNANFSLATQNIYSEMNLKYVPTNLLSNAMWSISNGIQTLRSNTLDNSSLAKANVSASRQAARNTFRVRRTGWHNVDAIFSGKRPTYSVDRSKENTGAKPLTTQPVVVSIKNIDLYDNIFVYLIPQGTSSFKRMVQRGESFSTDAWTHLKYDLVVIAHHGALTYATMRTDCSTEKITLNTLLPKSEDDLKNMLSTYYVMLNEDQVKQAELKVVMEEIKQIENDAAMRRKLEPFVFPCRGENWSGDVIHRTIPKRFITK
ncbi:MAG: hypothetical protein ACKVOR_00920 [Flavobacteriales bacterium]